MQEYFVLACWFNELWPRETLTNTAEVKMAQEVCARARRQTIRMHFTNCIHILPFLLPSLACNVRILLATLHC